jgi:hypothetical protein
MDNPEYCIYVIGVDFFALIPHEVSVGMHAFGFPKVIQLMTRPTRSGLMLKIQGTGLDQYWKRQYCR